MIKSTSYNSQLKQLLLRVLNCVYVCYLMMLFQEQALYSDE
jgi:hypothetical protein